MKGEELPGFQEDGEYSERAFESWLREQAILPTQVTPSRIHNEVHTTHRSPFSCDRGLLSCKRSNVLKSLWEDLSAVEGLDRHALEWWNMTCRMSRLQPNQCLNQTPQRPHPLLLRYVNFAASNWVPCPLTQPSVCARLRSSSQCFSLLCSSPQVQAACCAVNYAMH